MAKREEVYVDIITETKKATDGIAGIIKQFAILGGAAIAARKLMDFGREMENAFRGQEQAVAGFASAARSAGNESNISLPAITDLASSLQKITLYGDEATLAAAGMLEQLTGLRQDGLEKVLPLTLDFSAAMGVDLTTSATLIGKTLGSTTNALSRYGIEIDMTGTESQKLADLTDALTSKFGGMAEALADTSSGELVQMQNALGDVKEEIGRLISDALEPGREKIATWASDFATAMAGAYEAGQGQREEVQKVAELQADMLGVFIGITEEQAKAAKDESTAKWLEGLALGYSEMRDRLIEVGNVSYDYVAGAEAINDELYTQIGRASLTRDKLDLVNLALGELATKGTADAITALKPFRDELQGVVDTAADAVSIFKEFRPTITIGLKNAFGPGLVNSLNLKNTGAAISAGITAGLQFDPQQVVAKLNLDKVSTAIPELDIDWPDMLAPTEAELAVINARYDAIAGLKLVLLDVKDLGVDLLTDAFRDLNEAVLAGTDFGAAVTDSIGGMLNAFKSRLPELLFSAGLQAMIAGNYRLGLVLLGMSGVGVIVNAIGANSSEPSTPITAEVAATVEEATVAAQIAQAQAAIEQAGQEAAAAAAVVAIQGGKTEAEIAADYAAAKAAAEAEAIAAAQLVPVGPLAGRGMFAGMDISLPVKPMAGGGIITRPTLVMAGEAGDEAFIPLRGRSGWGGNIIVQGDLLTEQGVQERAAYYAQRAQRGY